MNKIYREWKTITETDFVTLFIKTWFTYIATLRELFPEDYNRQGDKRFLNSYKNFFNSEGYKYLTIDANLSNEIEIIYDEGRKIILDRYPEFYFNDFYKMNLDLKYTYKDILPDNTEGIVVSIKHKENGIFSYNIVFWGNIRNQKYRDSIKGKVSFKEVINLQKNTLNKNISEFEYMSKIFEEFRKNIIRDIEEKFSNKIIKISKKSIKSKYIEIKEILKNNINSLIHLNTKLTNEKTFEEISKPKNEYCFIEQYPINYFLHYRDTDIIPNRNMQIGEEQYFNSVISEMRRNSINWFLDFVYRLRNALFHEIIDPFDEEWQTIFKNAYLVLKEIADININYLEGNKK